MFGPIRAVAIDDEPAHLLAITAGLSACGIPCIGYWYDRDTNNLSPAPAKGGSPYLRLVFMDLNLEEPAGRPEAASLAGVVISVLEQIISEDGGPYLLIFWTQIGVRVDEVTALLYQRLKGVLCPLLVTQLPKATFLLPEPQAHSFGEALHEFYSALNGKMDELRGAIKQAVDSSPELSVISAWESRASDASAKAVNSIAKCARNDVNDPSRVSESIRKILAGIASAAAGPRTAQKTPCRALDGGMIEILVDQLGTSVEDATYRETLEKAIGESVKNWPQFEQDVLTCAALNTFCHLDKEINEVTPLERGVVISAKSIKGMLGFKPISYLDEFLIPADAFPPELQEEMKALERTARASGQFVLIEAGTDCDHAQDTNRTLRYLLGLEISDNLLKLARFPKNLKLRNESLQLLGPWILDDEIKYLLVSCARFWIWQNRTPQAQATIKYRLRSSIITKLLHHYSAFSSRPGIIEFNPTS